MIIKIVDEDHFVSFDMEKWKGQGPYLSAIAKGTTKQRRHALDHADKRLLLCLCECALNVLQGNVKLTSSEKKALARYGRKLKILAHSNIPQKYKRQVLRQRGSGKFFQNIVAPILKQLPSLLPAVVPLLL